MTSFTTIIALVFSAMAVLVAAAPLNIARDVWAPQIFSPNADSVWEVCECYQVTWNTSTKPAQVTNPQGKIILSKGGLLDVEHPLASGFNLTDGNVTITVPCNTTAGNDYAIVLFGDSGNASPYFVIEL